MPAVGRGREPRTRYRGAVKIAVRASLAMLALTGLAAPARAGWEDYRFTADLVLDARASDGAAGTIDAGPSLRASLSLAAVDGRRIA